MKKFLLSLYNILTTAGVRLLLKRLGVTVGGFWGWIISEVIFKVLDKFVKPWVLMVTRKIKKKEDLAKAEDKVEALNEATTPDEYLDALNNK